jgi:hypothetical protein
MYLVFAIIAGLIGGAMSIAIRFELMEPGIQLFDHNIYNVVVTAPGITAVLHGDAGDDRRLRQLDHAADDRAPDMAFPRSTTFRSGCCRRRSRCC